MKMKSNHPNLMLLSAVIALTTAASAQAISYQAPPKVIWNQAIQTIPSQTNDIAISPDSSWLYVTSVNKGTLSKLNPSNGKFVQYYDKLGVEAAENGRYGYGQGGIEFYMDDSSSGGSSSSAAGGSYIIYWVLDVSSQGYYSKVVCVEHDEDPNSESIVIRWVATLSGILNGMPQIGSDGKFIYLTINADTNTPISVNTNDTTESTATDGGEGEGVSPSDEPPSSSSNTNDEPAPTPFWFVSLDSSNSDIFCEYGTDFPELSINGTSVNATLFETKDECCKATPAACLEPPPVIGSNSTTNETTAAAATTSTGEPAEASSSGGAATADATPAGDTNTARRQLQAQKSGRFIILDVYTGNVVYSFDSRSDFTIRKHEFGPLGIARRPVYGNYAGGEGNTNDVVMWGSGSGQDDDNVGETLLFQLPKGVDTTNVESTVPPLLNQFETRVMESVSWTTKTPPAFSKDGLAVYFLISGDRLTGWNNGQKFDIAPNVGPVDLTVANSVSGMIQRPIVLIDDDKTVLVGVQDAMYGVDVSRAPASIWWKLDNLGSGAAFTTPQITPDGTMAYFGKTGALHALNLTAGGALLWEDTNGYVDPFSAVSQITMADFSLDASGQTLYYCRGGSDTITALKIGELVPTEDPTSSPSVAPSVTASMAPSTSMAPTLSMIPTNDPDYISPSMSPSETLSDAPSFMPSVKPTVSPTKSLSPSFMPVLEPAFAYPGSPTPDAPPTAPPNTNTAAGAGNPTSLASTKNDENTSTIPLSMAAIIGIAVGGGVGLILLLGSLCYVCRKKPCKGGGDDGVDTDWQSSNDANQQMQFSGGGGEGGGNGEGETPFQYGDEESDGNQQHGEPLKW